MKYEIACKEDAEELYALQLRAFESEAEMIGSRNVPALIETYEHSLADFSNWTVLIKRDDSGKIIGAVRYKKVADHIDIGRLMVAQEHRNRGVASDLMRAVEKMTGESTFELYTCTKSYTNIRLYERLGYRIFKKERGEHDLSFAYMRKTVGKSGDALKMDAAVELRPLEPSDREQFIRDNQEAFNYGALEEFGRRDDHFEEEGEIISRETIEKSIDGGEVYRILLNGEKVGGVVLRVDGERGDLELLFVSPRVHSRGVGYAAWRAVERLHPEVRVWETVTPYFERRNIHFYVNRCGFHIVEFYNRHHPDPNDPEATEQTDEQFPDGMFRFEKRMEL